MQLALRYRNWLVAATLLLVAGNPARARATLGEDVASVAVLKARLGATLQVHARERFAIHELALPTGAKLREFADDAGKVFAVSWSGGFRPNLRDVMGSHYDRFIAATRGRRAARGIARTELPGLVVVVGGHLRNSFGYVLLSDRVPAGLEPADLR